MNPEILKPTPEVNSIKPDVSKELEGYIELVEKNRQTNNSHIVLDDIGQPILQPIENKEIIIKLPLTEAQITQGLQQNAQNAFAWLATFCNRMLKIFNLRKESQPTNK